MHADIRIEQIDEICLTPEQDRAIAQLIDATYSADFQGRSFCHQRHHLRLLAWQEDRLDGHIALLFRSMRLGADLIDVMGIAEVATAKIARKQGIATKLLNQALEVAGASTAEFVLLFGTESLYSKAGFKPYKNKMRATSLASGRSGDAYAVANEPLMVCPVGSRSWNEKAELDLLGSIF